MATEETAINYGRVDYLDGWRGLAIAMVLQSHFLPIYGFMQSGTLGVHMFFCLSGLLMSNLLFVKRTPLLIFYERRISRIIPVFVIFVLTIFALQLLSGRKISIIELASTLTFFRTYIPSVPHIWNSTLPLGHLWSLNIEEHSYIFMSILTLIVTLRKYEGLALIGVGAMAMLAYLFYATHPNDAPNIYTIRTECGASFIMVSAGYSLLKHRISQFVTPSMPIISLLAAACCYLDRVPFGGGARSILCPILLSFTVNHLSESCAVLLRLLRQRSLCLLGTWSYSIYLWQQPFFENKPNLYPGAPLLLSVSIGISSYYLIEDPLRKWLNEKRYLQKLFCSGVHNHPLVMNGRVTGEKNKSIDRFEVTE